MLVQTQMRSKMFNAAKRAASSKATEGQRSIINAVATAMDVGVGIHKVPDWNAHLSFRTHERLKAQGIMA